MKTSVKYFGLAVGH